MAKYVDDSGLRTYTNNVKALINVKADDLLYEDSKLYLLSNGEKITEGIEISGGGGGAEMFTLTTSMPTDQSYSKDDTVVLTCNFQTPNNAKNAVVRYFINGVQRDTQTITNVGNFSRDITSLLGDGSNQVEVRVTDAYSQTDTLLFNITIVVLSISSTFDSSVTYTSDVIFRYTPVGEVTKTVHFKLDGVETTETVTSSGRQLTKTLELTNGVHTFEVWCTATVNSNTITSNKLKYEIMFTDNSSILIASEFDGTTFKQGENITIPFSVYDPSSLYADVNVYIDGTLVSEMSVDRTRHYWNGSISTVGESTITFTCGDVHRDFDVTITEVVIPIEPVEENLALFLTAKGRTNYDLDKEDWDYEDIHCTLSNFNFNTNGWINNSLVINAGASVTIPYQIFVGDLRTTGKTIEFEFSVSDVLNYNTTVISCFSGNRGIQVNAQNALLKSEQSEVEVKFKEDEVIRLSFVIENRNAHRLIYTYMNGIISGLAQYPVDDDFAQSSPVNISLTANNCTLKVNTIRIYDADLSEQDMLNNWIYDTPDINEKIDRYNRNNIYDSYGNILYNNILAQIPIMTITGDLPSVKGDKKKVHVVYEDQQNPDNSFDMNNVTLDIQGTSSQYYPKKNYKISKLPEAYSLRGDASIGEKVFTLKADYMESSHAHNTGLARYVNGIFSALTPPQRVDSRVRTSIDGFPIAMFYRQNESENAVYFGVYNFDNDKSSNNVWGFVEGDESWEVCNNTSDRCLFKSDDFSDSSAVLTDFEARFPSDYEDTTTLHTLVSWIVSCDSTQATGNALSEPVTYDGVEYTTDSADYRIAKFRNECSEHFNLNYLLTYYIFAELFGMVDSFAKNLFLNYYTAENLWYPVFYDLDTAIGLNNEGVNDFNFNIEYHDTIGTENVFNGQSSALWNMLERAFQTEINETYNTLRNNGKLTYNNAIKYLDEDQISKICEAQYNEDCNFKYISPLVDDNIATYLYTAQGSRVNHIKWWLYNRFRYMDSKYVASDYQSNYITLRLYTPSSWHEVEPDATITLTSYISQYLRIKYGSYVVYTRAEQNTPTDIVPPPITFNDTETIIYGASSILSVGDLAPLYAGTIDMSNATKLAELKIGHGGEYENTNLKSLTLGNNTMLQLLDIRNCSALSGALDISGCTNIHTIKATGTALASVTLPNASSITTLELPTTITNLTVKNQTNISTFTCGRNMTTLVLENTNLNSKQLFEESLSLTKIRLTGINWNLGSSFALLDRAYALGGLDEQGYNLDHGVISGTVYMNNVKRSIADEYEAKFTGLTIIITNPIEEDYIYTDFGEIITTNDSIPLLYT